MAAGPRAGFVTEVRADPGTLREAKDGAVPEPEAAAAVEAEAEAGAEAEATAGTVPAAIAEAEAKEETGRDVVRFVGRPTPAAVRPLTLAIADDRRLWD